MSGLMNTPSAAPASSGPSKTEMGNALLQQAEAKIESQLTPENRANYDKIVVSGLHAALDKGPNGILASLRDGKNTVERCAKGAVGIVVILSKQSKGIMPIKAMIPAGMTLMLKALDFVDRAGILKVGEPEIVQATHFFTDAIFRYFGITKQMLGQATQKVEAITRDPVAMQKINLKAGITKHPGAVG